MIVGVSMLECRATPGMPKPMSSGLPADVRTPHSMHRRLRTQQNRQFERRPRDSPLSRIGYAMNSIGGCIADQHASLLYCLWWVQMTGKFRGMDGVPPLGSAFEA